MGYQARHYDPRLGRFVSPDSIVHSPNNPHDLNRYAYVRNNPLRYVDPTGHQVEVVFQQAQACFAGGPCQQMVQEAQALAVQYGPQIAQAVTDFVAVYGPQIPAVVDQVFQFGEQADAAGGQSADKGGNASNADPNDPFKPFRNEGERYQHQTSGTRYGEEPELDLFRNGKPDKVKPDNIVDEYVSESKFVDMTRKFYSKQMGKTGKTGLDWHVEGWHDEFERLSLAAEQNGYRGVKVFVNSLEAKAKAIEMYGGEFGNMVFIFQPLQ